MKLLKNLSFLVIGAFAFIISYYNKQIEVNLNIFGFVIQCPIWLVIGVFFLLGLIASQIVCLIDDIDYTKKIKEYKKEIKQLKDEVLTLRKLTLNKDE
ncbi:MAG: lipopolysaccharide assembly protein LapA domain-containing protein [Desulfurella sp.]|uniref:lipopolysaccharide assembly protein LapA domain-containing protein n=1 Tax=Desulfurella sp. TaxID=1962857 RepID=UPI003C77FF3D